MFDGFKYINNNICLFLNNNYEFSSDINTKNKKEKRIIDECKNFLRMHNISFKDRLYFAQNNYIIGYINKDKLY